MGNLLRLLSRDSDSCCSLPKTGDLFVDFESAKASEEESHLYDEAEVLLDRAKDVIKDLQEYKGAVIEIREAIKNPSEENEATAWATVLPLVMRLKTFYDFSCQLETIIPKLLTVLCSPNHGIIESTVPRRCMMERLDDHQALVKQFAKFLDFALKFDECKIGTPAVQNDFSFYRRTIQRNKQIPNDFEEGSRIPPDVANGMSLFFAHATPMLKKLGIVTSQFVKENTESENQVIAKNTTEMLSVMAKVCQKMLDIPELKSRLQYQETEFFILRVMVASIIIYDHVHETGAFAKGSTMDVKGCVKVLKDQDQKVAENLLNGLRYSTLHLNDESTPKSLKNLLFETQTARSAYKNDISEM